MLYVLETLLKWLLMLTALRYLIYFTSFDTMEPEEGRHITKVKCQYLEHCASNT